MEVPAGIPVSYSHEGVRVPVDGRAPGLFRCWLAIAITALVCVFVGLSAPGGGLFWFAVATGFWMFWPVEHSVIELQSTALRVFTDGAWERIPWTEIDAVGMAGLVLTIFLANGRRVQIPAHSSSRAARWLAGVVGSLTERAKAISSASNGSDGASHRLQDLIATIRRAS